MTCFVSRMKYTHVVCCEVDSVPGLQLWAGLEMGSLWVRFDECWVVPESGQHREVVQAAADCQKAVKSINP